MTLVGVLEIMGAIGLHIQSLRIYASAGLILLMIGAIYNHLMVNLAISQSAPSIVLFIASCVFIYLSIKKS